MTLHDNDSYEHVPMGDNAAFVVGLLCGLIGGTAIGIIVSLTALGLV